jgi:arylsulfatase A-like enzyme
MDDLGYGDVSCYGATELQTPEMDALAAEGIRFTDAHSPSSFCSPSRYSLLTGRHSMRASHPRLRKGVFLPNASSGTIELDRFTLPKLFQQAGYTTALIGKWHLGDGTTQDPKKYDAPDYSMTQGPNDCGFDYFYGIVSDRHFAPYKFVENRKIARDEQGNFIETNDIHMDKPSAILAKRAVRYLKENADKSIFLYFNPNMAHLPHTPSEPFKGKSKAGYYGDFVVEGDWMVGQIVKTLRELGVLDQTLLIVTSDNGGDDINYAMKCSFRRWPKYYAKQGYDQKNFPWIGKHKPRGVLDGSKASMKEGGHRVPFIVHWPEYITSPKVSDTLIYQMDILASFGELLNIPVPKDQAEDSISVLPNMLGDQNEPLRKEFIMIAKDGQAIRQGNWKLCRGNWDMLPDIGGKKHNKGNNISIRLFNLTNDMAEKNDLSAQHPEKVKEMLKRLDEIITSRN